MLMKSLNPYLAFAGNCEEALDFYKDCLGGDITMKMTFGQSPMPVDDSHKDKIMHAEFKAGDVQFMASDGMPGFQVNPGNNVTMSLNFSDQNEQESTFNNLANGGNVTMPLQDTFWGAKFGMLTDKYGINWMFNCQSSEQ